MSIANRFVRKFRNPSGATGKSPFVIRIECGQAKSLPAWQHPRGVWVLIAWDGSTCAWPQPRMHAVNGRLRLKNNVSGRSARAEELEIARDAAAARLQELLRERGGLHGPAASSANCLANLPGPAYLRIRRPKVPLALIRPRTFFEKVFSRVGEG